MIMETVVRAGGYVPYGKQYLAGNVKVSGTAASKRLAVFFRGSLQVIASTVSKSDGTWRIIFGAGWSFTASSCLVVYFDDSGEYNAETSDLVTPVAYTGEG